MRNDSTAFGLVFAAWLVASAASLGALFFSEVMQLAPCELCWYQRIFMFSLAVILLVGLLPFDGSVLRYALPLATFGLLFAVFHQLMVLGVIPESVRPCTQGVPCSEKSIEWFGFVTIPTLATLAFSAILGLLAVARLRGSR